MPGHQRDLPALGDRVAELQERAASLGRGAIPVSIFGARPESVESYVVMGASRAVFLIRAAPAEDAIAEVERVASALRHVV